MLDIVTVGSATVDVFVNVNRKQQEVVTHEEHADVCYHLGSKVLVNEVTICTGGGGTNTAAAFSRLGFDTGWVGVLGNDDHSDIIEAQLKSEGVKILGPRKKGRAGYSVILSGVERDHVVLAYKGINDQLRYKDFKFAKTRWLYLCSMMGESLQTVKRLAHIARDKKIPYAFNPSMYLTYNIKTIRSILEGCNVLILNREEAQSLLNTVRDEYYLLKELRRITKGIVVITDGERGAYASDGIRRFCIKPRKTTVIENTGAGDAFGAGFVAGLMMNKGLEHALRMGQAEASAVLSHIGAKEKLLKQREVNRALRNLHAEVKPL